MIYPSDISREQFEIIQPFLESARKQTKPRTIDLYDVFCGLLYILKGGCQWRQLPKDYPKWRTVHEYFLIWSRKPATDQPSILEQVLNQLVQAERQGKGRDENTKLLIVDAQSVSNTDTAEHKGYDAGKKVSGIKRHIGVDTQGLPHFIEITTANETDRKGALQGIENHKEKLSKVTTVLADGGYTGKPFAEGVKQHIVEASVTIAKRSELHTFAVIPKRWVVERSFSWLEKCRRLWKNCERLLNSSLHMVVLAFIKILLNRS
jgi:transposase